MGVTKLGLEELMPEMYHSKHHTDSSVASSNQGQNVAPVAVSEEVPVHIFDGVSQGQPDLHKLKQKMRLKLTQEEITTGLEGCNPDLCSRGHLTNLLLKSGASHELSMSLPNLTAALDMEVCTENGERQVRSSLSNIFDGKQDLCSQKSLTELTKCIKALSNENFHALRDSTEAAHKAHVNSVGNVVVSTGKSDDIKIDVNGGHNRLSAVLENIPLLYIPHTKQLVSMAVQSKDVSPLSPGSNGKSPPASPATLKPEQEGGDQQNVPVVRNHVENGLLNSSPSSSSCSPESAPPPSARTCSSFGSYVSPSSDVSLDSSQMNLLSGLDGDCGLALSQDSDASSTCRSEHTVIHRGDDDDDRDPRNRRRPPPQELRHSRTVDFDDDDGGHALDGCFSKVCLDRGDSPRSTIHRTNTMGSLSRADASSFSSISSISTATDFSMSAASCSDDYLELRAGGGGAAIPPPEVDEAGFMEVNLHSRNTFERSRNSSQDSGIDEKQCLGAKPKRRGLSSFFGRNLFSRKAAKESPTDSGPPPPGDAAAAAADSIAARGATSGPNGGSCSASLGVTSDGATCTTNSGPGWKLFGRVPLKQAPQKDSREITRNYQAKVKAGSSTQQHPPPQSTTTTTTTTHPVVPRAKRPDVEAPSTTALILENRPSNLPSKDPEEELRHRQEYEAMVEASRKREQREAKLRKKQQQQQLKQEEALAAALRVWNSDILPTWDSSKNSKKARDLWWLGIPPAVRGKVWQLAIGNELNLTPELYEICLNRAKDRLKLMQEGGDSDSICSQASEPSSSKEASVEVIKLDVSRTFPQLCIFQKGGPYYELLQGLLGAYACYRPDVGYVQGMSFIAAVLLLNMEVADAFICFANLLNRPCQIAFFRLDESLMRSYFSAYEEFFRENLPRLFGHFEKQGLTSDLYIIDWMFTLYAKSLPLDVASRVWDVFCRDGEEFLFRTALGILRMYEDILLSLDFIHLAQFLTKLPENIHADTLFKAIDSINMTVEKKRFAQVLTQFREPKET